MESLEPLQIMVSWINVKTEGTRLQELFHVYLNKFKNAVTQLFLDILGNS